MKQTMAVLLLVSAVCASALALPTTQVTLARAPAGDSIAPAIPEVVILLPGHGDGIIASDGCVSAPTLLEPANGAQLDTLHPTFRWDAGSDPAAASVKVELHTNPSFPPPAPISYQGPPGQGTVQWQVWRDLQACTVYY